MVLDINRKQWHAVASYRTREIPMKAIATIITLSLVAIFFSSLSFASERKELSEVNSDDLLEETQVSAPVGSDHFNLIWWIPH